jgi:hypothetical protein
MCPELAALRAGYHLQELRHRQTNTWGRTALAVNDVDSCLLALDTVLHSVSDRLNNYQRDSVLELEKLISSRHDAADQIVADIFIETMKEGNDRTVFKHRVATGDACNQLRGLEEQAWKRLRTLLRTITKKEAAWFEIGERLGELIFALLDNKYRMPLADGRWNALYAGVSKLSERVRRQVEAFFPHRYRSCAHLAYRLRGTYEGLCAVLEDPVQGLLALPECDGKTLTYRHRTCSPKAQSNSVIVPILNEFQRLGWPDSIDKPEGLKGDVKQALFHLSKTKVIHLSPRGGKIFWR